MPTYFEGLKRDFKHVTVGTTDEIDTTEFLEAAEGVVHLFDLFGTAAFSIVQGDMNGNITKIRNQETALGDKGKTLQSIVLSEVGQKKKDATQGLLWLTRGLEFTAVGMRKNIENPDQELASSFNKAYAETLSQYHSWAVRPIFKLAMKSCPYRKELYDSLGHPYALVMEQLKEWLDALEKIVAAIQAFLASGDYAKGL